jgi:hypothetical protein
MVESNSTSAWGKQHVRDGKLVVRQQKTGTSLEIPIHRELRAILDVTPSDHLTFLVTKDGKPYSANGFTYRFKLWARQAGLRGCPLHGLRKAACRRLAEAGCEAPEIMAISQIRRAKANGGAGHIANGILPTRQTSLTHGEKGMKHQLHREGLVISRNDKSRESTGLACRTRPRRGRRCGRGQQLRAVAPRRAIPERPRPRLRHS